VLVEELDHLRVGLDSVLAFREAVALVLVDEQFGRDVFARGLDHLLGLAERDPRVVRAVDDEQRRTDAVGAVDRTDGFEELAVIGERSRSWWSTSW
jgi:hypothetical protein